MKQVLLTHAMPLMSAGVAVAKKGGAREAVRIGALSGKIIQHHQRYS